ncbi:phosphatidylserine decarboxylase [Pelagibius sp. Alg239-R121]|uniref:phosphatidylserine decarboxylase n=1 Tax=Pelagibius sp. Alg239-R121 TaxID=2993448 RepID=UPI0024A6D810|nr:phosphatidylserine decarboxylase [Pelagibius sp. Alg239-R121]
MEKDLLKYVLVPVNRAGWPFIAGALLLAVILALVWPPLVWLGLLLAAFCTYFFRDPDRFVPVRPGLVVSPADGLVSAVEPAVPPAELGMGDVSLMRVSIFLSVFDVHVNRVPTDGTITELAYHEGAFLNAAMDKASDLNERQSVRMTTSDGREIAFVQIAGLIARRIICNLTHGQSVRGGERFGLIRFGSRTDIYLPDGVAPMVIVGQRMIGGETIIADLTSSEEIRAGEIR